MNSIKDKLQALLELHGKNHAHLLNRFNESLGRGYPSYCDINNIMLEEGKAIKNILEAECSEDKK